MWIFVWLWIRYLKSWFSCDSSNYRFFFFSGNWKFAGHQGQKLWERKKPFNWPTIDMSLDILLIPFSPLNDDQIIVTFNFIQAHSFLLKKISWITENCLMEIECWVAIAWGCLAIMLHEIRHSLFQLLKIRSHEKWQREKKGRTFTFYDS